MATFKLITVIKKEISNNKKSILFLDLSKAFDTVSVNLLEKLNRMDYEEKLVTC